MFDTLGDKLAELGEPEAEFATSTRRAMLHAVLAPLVFALGMALAVMPVMLFGRLHAAGFKAVLFGLVLIAGALVLVVRTIRNHGIRVLVYPEGLVRMRGDDAVAFCWDEIEVVRLKKSEGHWAHLVGGALVYTVERSHAEPVQFTDYLPDLEKLGTLIQRHSLPHLWPRALKSLEAGETLEFGDIRLDKYSITKPGESLPWSEIQDFQFSDSLLVILRHGKRPTWYEGSLARIPNPHVLREVAGHMLRKP